METLGAQLMRSALPLRESWRGNKQERPAGRKCSYCDLPVYWFWLESDAPAILPSQWKQHPCVCRTILYLTLKFNQAIDSMERIKKEIDNNFTTKKHNEKGLEYLGEIVRDITFYLERKSRMMKEVVAMKALPDPNLEYLNRRYHLAKQYDAWREIFECKDKAETDFYLQVIPLEQPDLPISQSGTRDYATIDLPLPPLEGARA